MNSDALVLAASRTFGDATTLRFGAGLVTALAEARCAPSTPARAVTPGPPLRSGAGRIALAAFASDVARHPDDTSRRARAVNPPALEATP